MGYYQDLTPEDRVKITSAYVGLKMNSKGQGVSQKEAIGAFARATGKQYSMQYARDPAVTQLMKLVKRGSSVGKSSPSPQSANASGYNNRYSASAAPGAADTIPVRTPAGRGRDANRR